jgi:hypothetical protein
MADTNATATAWHPRLVVGRLSSFFAKKKSRQLVATLSDEIGDSQILERVSILHVHRIIFALTLVIASSSSSIDKDFLNNLGTIDVVILRCRSKSTPAVGLDGLLDTQGTHTPGRRGLPSQYDGPAEDDTNWGQPLLPPGYSFNQAGMSEVNNTQGGHDLSSPPQMRREPRTDKVICQDEEHLRVFHSYFNEIECSATATRAITEKIEFLEDAIRNARLKAPDLEQGLVVEQGEAIRERDDHRQNMSTFLGKALDHICQLSHEPWRLCRDFIINSGWLNAEHPALRAPHEHLPGANVQLSDQQDQERDRAQLFDQWLEHQSRVKFNPRLSTTGHANTSYSDRPIDVSPTHLSFENDQSGKYQWEKESGSPRHDSVPETGRQWQAEASEDPWKHPNQKDGPPAIDGIGSWSQHSRVQSSTGSAQVHKSKVSPYEARIVKPYWKTALQDRAAKSGNAYGGPWDPYICFAEPPPAVPKGHKTGVKYSVQIGKGVEYLHNLGTPEYIDTMTAPYVVFTFKYRSPEELEKLIGRSVQDDVRALTENILKQQLQKLPKHELVEQIVRSKTQKSSRSVGGDGRSRSSRSWGASEPESESKTDWLKNSTANKPDWPSKQESKHERNDDWPNSRSNGSRHARERDEMKSKASAKSHDRFQEGQSTKGEFKHNKGWEEVGQGKTSAAW